MRTDQCLQRRNVDTLPPIMLAQKKYKLPGSFINITAHALVESSTVCGAILYDDNCVEMPWKLTVAYIQFQILCS